MQAQEAERLLGRSRQLYRAGRFAEAATVCRNVLRHLPRHVTALSMLGANLAAQGKADDALAAYRKALAIKPDDITSLSNLANFFIKLKRYGDAIDCSKALTEKHPREALGHANLSSAYFYTNDLVASAAAAREAIRVAPGNPTGHKNLGRALYRQGIVEDAVDCYKRALELQPQDADGFEAMLAIMHFSPRYGAKEIADLHREWDRRFTRKFLPKTLRVPNDNARERPLRVGFVSPDLHRHPVSYFLESLFEARDPKAWDIVCYADVLTPDDLTEKLKNLSTDWRYSFDLSDDRLADQIRKDKIDILIDLVGHTTKNRLGVFARKPAPVQATWIGYFNATGLEAMDYLICDKVGVPDDARNLYVETPLRMPDGFSCYAPPEWAPPVAPLPAHGNGYVTFGSFNQITKITREVVTLWAEILKAVPTSRLVIRTKALKDVETRERYRNWFVADRINPSRIDLIPPGSQIEILRTYGKVDIGLDPFPVAGGTTTCESLWMGVPVVTLLGDRYAGRMSGSYMTTAGLPQFVAESPAEYVAIAKSAAADMEDLARLRDGLREQVRRSPMVDARRFARSFSAALRQMWRYRDPATRPRVVDVPQAVADTLADAS